MEFVKRPRKIVGTIEGKNLTIFLGGVRNSYPEQTTLRIKLKNEVISTHSMVNGHQSWVQKVLTGNPILRLITCSEIANQPLRSFFSSLKLMG